MCVCGCVCVCVCVCHRFIQRPEYLSLNSRFVFREGRTKGIGIIIGKRMHFVNNACLSPRLSHPRKAGYWYYHR